jgi:DNA-directed RNA polymerase subunit M/transcription elongation factor TFIIS|tara:strand:- start:70 stop:303 length:234 start_codon:yes stop_codon:yes gene_type:complete
MNREQPGLKVDISQTTAVSCEKCKHDVFIPAFKMRKLSALLSPAGKETMVPVNVFACAKCGHINEEFLPKLNENDAI